MRSTPYGRDFELVQRHEVQLSKLQTHLLNQKPQIVHFSGHGSIQGRLLFQNEIGVAQEAPIESVANLFRILNQEAGLADTDKIRLVVLNACYSEKQAKAIAKYVDCVVGMSTEVTDESARKFAEAFYRGLGHGKSVEDAYELARNQLGLEAIPEGKTPKLRCREGVNPSTVSFKPAARSTTIVPPQDSRLPRPDTNQIPTTHANRGRKTIVAVVVVVIVVGLMGAIFFSMQSNFNRTKPVPLDVDLITPRGPGTLNSLLVNEGYTFEAIVRNGQAPYTYTWNFDDGPWITSSRASITHSFSDNGLYSVTVIANDSNGNEGRAYGLVRVE